MTVSWLRKAFGWAGSYAEPAIDRTECILS